MQNLASVGTEQMRKAALLPENKAKNRFTNVLPCKPVTLMSRVIEMHLTVQIH